MESAYKALKDRIKEVKDEFRHQQKIRCYFGEESPEASYYRGGLCAIENIERTIIDIEAMIEIETEFYSLISTLKAETKFDSFQNLDNATYRAIVKMGPLVIPLILKEMDEGRSNWYYFCILEELTRESLTKEEDAGYFEKITELWLAWGREKGYLK